MNGSLTGELINHSVVKGSMNTPLPNNTDLTIFDRDINWYEKDLPSTIGIIREHDVFMRAKLSNVTRQIMERYYAKKQAKKKPRKRTKARGQFHWKRKEATRLRAAARRWKDYPLACLMHSYGMWAISPKEWSRCLGPIWSRYDPAQLKVKRPWGHGTTAKPYTVYNIRVVHTTLGVVYDGQNQQIYDLSNGSY